jgi:transcription-repair coupling factor (superfamily II helicase)
LKIKLYAEAAGLSSISAEGEQLVMRFRSGSPPSGLSALDPAVRIGKTALWMPFNAAENWPDRLVEILQTLGEQVKELSTS